jgi:hypothetical protein
MMPIKFYFDAYPEQLWDGVEAGGTWNGFDNVAVTPEVARQIDAFFQREADAGGYTNEDPPIGEMPIGRDGLIDLSNGYATTIASEP